MSVGELVLRWELGAITKSDLANTGRRPRGDVSINGDGPKRDRLMRAVASELNMEESSFKDFILDQLNALGGVTAKRMFGAYGLYCEAVFFGIIDESRLYFKTDPESRKEYKALGSGPFFYYRKDKTGKKKKAYLKTYYEVPADILEDGVRLVIWAKRAVDAQAQSE